MAFLLTRAAGNADGISLLFDDGLGTYIKAGVINETF